MSRVFRFYVGFEGVTTMIKMELKNNEIAVFRVDNHLDMVILRDRINEEGEQLFKVGQYNRETDGYGSLDYSLSFDKALRRLRKRSFTNLKLKFMGITHYDHIDYKERYEKFLNETKVSTQYHKETLQHLLGLLGEDMLVKEDIIEKIKELP